MGPIVLIISYGFIKPIDIVKNLLSLKSSTSTTTTTTTATCHNNKKEEILKNSQKEILINEIKFQTYNYEIKNKYFETNIQLLPYEEPINTIPNELLKLTETLIVSFNSADKTFLKHVPKLCKLSEESNIELNLLITGQLYDDCNKGLSYGDVKDACKHTFDVIEILNKDEEDDEGDDKDNGDKNKDNEESAKAKDNQIEDKATSIPTATEASTSSTADYSEIIEALENHIWTNVAAGSSSGGKDSNKTTKIKTPVNNPHHDDDADDNDDLDEAQLEAYEALLTNIVNFKSTSSNLNRDQMLDKAEKLAELFAEFMGED